MSLGWLSQPVMASHNGACSVQAKIQQRITGERLNGYVIKSRDSRKSDVAKMIQVKVTSSKRKWGWSPCPRVGDKVWLKVEKDDQLLVEMNDSLFLEYSNRGGRMSSRISWHIKRENDLPLGG